MAKRTLPLQPSDIDFFNAEGYLQLKGFHPGKQMAGIKKSIMDELRRLNVWASGKSLPSPLRALPPFQQIARLSTLVKIPGMHEAVMTPQLSSVIASLAGRTPSAIQDTQLLLSLPNQGTWTLEGLNWHVDVAAEPPTSLPGIQAFLLIDEVSPHGGATLTLAGSHKAMARQAAHQPALRDILKTSTDLATSLQGTGIHVVEMSGQAGDVFLMDMRLLHTPSINATKHIRMMATARFFLGA
ncbi:phytanoyl-CoA dioxygenase family protein [Polaromonas sp.]|uniref:phytanoyl-CoA dioxygenase family protein n=1 Tax=Polaromonas sp. TaxID=1869339 RepID=UPI00326582F6